MRPGNAVTLTLLMALCSTVAIAQTELNFQFRFTEAPGKYAVGFNAAEQYARSRSFSNEARPSDKGPRPLQILVWYPAQNFDGPHMTLGDYAALIETETSFDTPVKEGKPQAFVRQYMHGRTKVATWAVRDTPMQAGTFPIVVYAPSLNASATENIELCEFLASHGFVVLASPSMGATSRTMTVSLADADAQAKDISFLIDYAGTLPDTDMSEVAAIGYSWGGMAALFDAARDKRVRALISMDGSFRYAPAAVQKAGDIHPEKMLIPLLVFSRAEETLEAWDAMRNDKDLSRPSPSVLNEWTHGDLLHVHLLAISHIQFSSLYQRSERFREEALHFVPADYSLEEGAASYNWMARYTLRFLKAYLKQDPIAKIFLARTPTENGVPKHLMASEFRAASPNPAVAAPKSGK